MANSERIILIDADVVSHFVTAGQADCLKQIFPDNPIRILDKVHAELQQWPSAAMRTEVSRLISKKIIRLMDFPDDNDEIARKFRMSIFSQAALIVSALFVLFAVSDFIEPYSRFHCFALAEKQFFDSVAVGIFKPKEK